MSWSLEDLYRAEAAFKDAVAQIPEPHRKHVKMEITELKRCVDDLVTSVGLIVEGDDGRGN